jgi:hypothetical protein
MIGYANSECNGRSGDAANEKRGNELDHKRAAQYERVLDAERYALAVRYAAVLERQRQERERDSDGGEK